MSHEILYHCSHLEEQRTPLPPSYPSSFADFSPLSHLYFCEECDAIRCDQCVAVEVASYYCPTCLFDVPGANVRQDRNRCSRSCFACPECSASLTTIGAENPDSSQLRASTASQAEGKYFLICPACKWTSKEIEWQFDKATGLAGQVSNFYSLPQEVNAEFDAIKEHLEGYLVQPPLPGVAPGTAMGHRRLPSRNIAQITQAARGALNRNLSAQPRPRHSVRRKPSEKVDTKVGWDELKPYAAKLTWRAVAVERGLADVEHMKEMAGEEVTPLEKRWTSAWEPPRMAKDTVPQRIPLQAKLTKRCPHPTCRHILIQPDTKTARMLIKTVASNYLPATEIGRRRLQLREEPTEMATEEDIERRRRDRRRARLPYMGPEKDEDMDAPMQAGETYSFQLAFTNPLYDPIQIRLGTAHQSRHLAPPNHHIFIPTAHFTVGASKDAWAYDDDDYDESGGEDDMAAADERSKRMSMLGGGSLRRGRDAGIEKRGNVTKAALEVQVLPGVSGPIEFDLEIRFTYRVEEEGGDEGDPDAEDGKDEYKTFTFWVRVCAGEVVA